MTSSDGAEGADGAVTPVAQSKGSPPRSKSGWDGKLRVDKSDKKAVLANPEALSDPDYSDEDAPPVDEIQADESWCTQAGSQRQPIS